jgi:transglutaminase-like putative cysteine protease
MPLFSIQHITSYRYNRPIKESVNEIKIFPIRDERQEPVKQELIITGNPELYVFEDYWGNQVAQFNLLAAHQELVIDSRIVVRTSEWNTTVLPNCLPESLEAAVNQDIRLLSFTQPLSIVHEEQMHSYVQQLFHPQKKIALIVQDCCQFIFEQFHYIKGITTVETTLDEILEKKAGVCQDFAHVMLQILRRMGIPCRYVSGYICPNKNGMRGEGATHAWVEAFIPSYGWLGFDPTNNVVATQHHVKLATGRDFSDCTPVKGSFKGPARQSLSVYVSVGYEDGASFEELTDVQMALESSNISESFTDMADEQQQQ